MSRVLVLAVAVQVIHIEQNLLEFLQLGNQGGVLGFRRSLHVLAFQSLC
jgi:hypothetical protein